MSNTHSTHSKSAESWHNPPTAAWQPISRALGGSPPIDCPPWVACGQPHSRVSGVSVWQIFTQRAAKATLEYCKSYRPQSVGRSLIGGGHHRLILPLCELRLNAPLQHRSHRPNVTTTARTKSIYCNVNRLELFIRLLPLLKSPSR